MQDFANITKTTGTFIFKNFISNKVKKKNKKQLS